MSVDQQIREGLVMLDQQLPTPDTTTAYEEIVHEARTRTRRSRLVRAGLVAAAAVAVAVAVQLGGGAPDSAPAPQPVDEPTAAPPSVVIPDGWADVAGRWRSDPVTAREMAQAAGPAASTSIVRGQLAGLPDVFDEPTGAPLVLTFDNGDAVLEAGDGTGTALDDQSYTVDRGVLTLRPKTAPGGRTRFAAEIRDGTLTLELLDTTVDPAPGGAEAARLSALYGTVGFTWAGEAG
jgi:hypothetical protein